MGLVQVLWGKRVVSDEHGQGDLPVRKIKKIVPVVPTASSFACMPVGLPDLLSQHHGLCSAQTRGTAWGL